MAREIYTAGGTITGLGTAWADVIPLVATGQVVLARVRAVHRGSSATTVTMAIWDASAELARVLHQAQLAPGEVLEADVRVAAGQRLRAQAGAAGVVDISIVHGVRQS